MSWLQRGLILHSSITAPVPSECSSTDKSNSKANNNFDGEQSASTNKGLNRTFSPHAMHEQSTTLYSDFASPFISAVDFGFGVGKLNDSSHFSDVDSSSVQRNGMVNISGNVTPDDSAWNPDDFLDYTGASD